MRITLLINTWHDGRQLTEGDVHDIADEIAADLIAKGAAVAADGKNEGAANATAPLVVSPADGDSPAANLTPTVVPPVEQPTPVAPTPEAPAPQPQPEAQPEAPAAPQTVPTPEEISATLQSIELTAPSGDSDVPLQ